MSILVLEHPFELPEGIYIQLYNAGRQYLVRITKKRNTGNNIKVRKTISKAIEKFTIIAGMMPIIGIINAAIYILLKQNNPSARFEKLFKLPSLAILCEIKFRSDMQREFLIL
jgi:hypothetical protein